MSTWHTMKRVIDLTTPRVMGILNITPDSFSDGGRIRVLDDARRVTALMISDGAAIIDVGGESTRPDSQRVSSAEEIERVVPVIESIVAEFDVPVSIDTSKADVASAALAAGAEIVNDISGFTFDAGMASVAAESGAGVVIMHLRGSFDTMHRLEPVAEIFPDVVSGLRKSIEAGQLAGVARDKIVLDVGIGFSKTVAQNLELLAKLGKLSAEFEGFPLLVGASRKSFIGRVLDDRPVTERLAGSLAAAAVAVWNGARIIRAHDVRETADAVRIASAIHEQL